MSQIALQPRLPPWRLQTMAWEGDQSSFIARRWNTTCRAYVDSKNNKLPDIKPVPIDVSSPVLYLPSKPPADGSAPFLSLPTELRLQIYDYLTDHDTVHLHDLQSTFDMPLIPSSPYAYLYRSPGRITKPNGISKQIIHLFHVCHQMRVELMDACFSDKTFVLEASLYQRDAAGLCVLPPNLGPTAWVKRLLLFTVVEIDGMLKGIADLRPLQQMTNLRELHIVFSVRKKSKSNLSAPITVHRLDNIFKAVLECVPEQTAVHFKQDDTFLLQYPFKLDTKAHDLFEDKNDTDPTLATVVDDPKELGEIKGRLSGSEINHTLCQYLDCLEGLGCVNSQLQLPWRPPPGTGLSLQTELQMTK